LSSGGARPSRGWPGWPAAAAAALTRAPGLALVAVAAAGGVLVAGLAAGPAIGFYLRNRQLYGSLTGAAYNQELFGFKPQDHVLDLLLSPAYALRL
jgi:hypothetical protein